VQDFDFKYHIFISHASEDKDDFVRPLAKKLIKIGYRVWYDEFSLTIGDKLNSSIEKGLKDSRFGLIVISPNFIKKYWTNRELEGLIQKESKDGKVILPIWHNVSYEQVKDFSYSLANTLAADSEKGLDHVVNEIVKALKQSGAYNLHPEKLDPVGHEQIKNWKAIWAGNIGKAFHWFSHYRFFFFSGLFILIILFWISVQYPNKQNNPSVETPTETTKDKRKVYTPKSTPVETRGGTGNVADDLSSEKGIDYTKLRDLERTVGFTFTGYKKIKCFDLFTDQEKMTCFLNGY
jgi:hypothetical protein